MCEHLASMHRVSVPLSLDELWAVEQHQSACYTRPTSNFHCQHGPLETVVKRGFVHRVILATRKGGSPAIGNKHLQVNTPYSLILRRKQ